MDRRNIGACAYTTFTEITEFTELTDFTELALKIYREFLSFEEHFRNHFFMNKYDLITNIKDPVNIKAFKELENYLINDLINIIKDYSYLPSWYYIGSIVQYNSNNKSLFVNPINLVYIRDIIKPYPFYCYLSTTGFICICIANLDPFYYK